MCEEMGIDTGLDIDKLFECARMAEQIVGHALPGKAKVGERVKHSLFPTGMPPDGSCGPTTEQH